MNLETVYLVNAVFIAQSIKSQKHFVNEGNDFHGCNSGADTIKVIQIAEHDGDAIKMLKGRQKHYKL